MAEKIAAGRRNKRITIERNVGTSRDASGHVVPSWQVLAKRWAAIEQLEGRELYNARQVQPDVTHKVTFLYADGTTPKMRVKHNTRTLEILSVINRNEEEVEHEAMCKESV